jgi:rSAM/selenodomain-associated transferase 1
MRNGSTIAAIIPALNEEHSIGKVVAAIPDWVDETIVGDNGSSDSTIAVAEAAGARVVQQTRRGYGSACLAAMAVMNNPDIVVYLDGDLADHPEQMDRLVDPIIDHKADIVIGSRVLGNREPGALTIQARFGNWLSCLLIRWFWGVRFTDLGPFRAIRNSTLAAIEMSDPDYGWTVEMQVKAAIAGVPAIEVPVDYRKRIGVSKVSGTIRGVIGAGTTILATIFLSALRQRMKRSKATAQKHRLIVMTRFPETGTVKTRLIETLGEEGATDLHRRMAERTVKTARGFSKRSGVGIEISFEGGGVEKMEQWLGRLPMSRQSSGDIGVRMNSAFVEAREAGSQRIVLIGADCPGISSALLGTAFDSLEKSDLVLGPAKDGGYYLIGLSHPHPELFQNIDWGSETVLEQTLSRARTAGISATQLPMLEDIDRPEDLGAWERISGEKL